MKYLAQFNSVEDDDGSFVFIKNDSLIVLQDTSKRKDVVLFYTDLFILYYGIKEFITRSAGGYFGHNNVTNKPYTIDINGKYSIVIYKGNIDKFSKKFTNGSTPDDNFECNSFPVWKMELHNLRTGTLLGTIEEQIYGFLPITCPVLIYMLRDNINIDDGGD